MNITTQELKDRLDKNQIINLIDVREPYEHEEFNIGGSLIPLGELPTRLSDLTIEKDQTVVVYCRSGNRSGMGQFLLKEAGFTDVLNLEGGMLAWEEMIKAAS
ncbi:UNVERIFIED_CONTAM: hypothetical protein GTU68_037936 [Idotea baltica]|nr:hypothetical protein [Idotea baltica]